MFIPKAGKTSHMYPKDYRPISLTSFLLKTMEKLLEMHIREIIGPNFFSNSQHAYMKGRSTESALHSLVAVVEKGLEFKEYSLGVFLHIAGAFNNVSIEAIIESLLETGINNAAFLWIGSLLRCRKMKVE